MLRSEELSSLKTELQKRRRAIIETARRTQREIEALRGAERDPEFEEGAQTEHEEYTLHRLGESHRREIQSIDAALARMESGEYGECIDCDIEIEMNRLRALPFALLCTDCASRRERGLFGGQASPPTL